MIVPLLFVFGLAYAGYKLGLKLRGGDFSVGHAAAALPAPRRVSYVAQLNDKVARKQPVTRWLVGEATREAYERGDWETVALITHLFGPKDEEAKKEEPAKDEPQVPTQDSPLEGINSGDWASFIEALTTKAEGFKSDKYVGRFEHNRTRLRQLGLEPPATPEDEYKAIVQDLSDYWDSEQKLIAECSGEVVTINGEQYGVTPSGVLGLLKAAGPQGAREWLDSETGRFPRTTDIFLRTNGCF